MRTLYDPESDVLIDGVLQTLEVLKEHRYRMCLVSRKEGQRQEKIHDLGIAHFFEEMHLVEDKQEAMEAIKKKHMQRKLWVVGDRVRGEIAVGNRIGAITVWFKNGAFRGEEPVHSDEYPDFTITSFSEFLKLLT